MKCFMKKIECSGSGFWKMFFCVNTWVKCFRLHLVPLSLSCLMYSEQGVFAKNDTAQDWTSLSGWANENNFKLNWTNKEEVFTLTNTFFKLSFKNDSQLAGINGVNVWLCNPITLKDGQESISSLDLSASIEPILFSQTNQVRATIQTICIDPGHGYKDTGGIFGRYVEKRYTLPLAEDWRDNWKRQGSK